MPSEDLAALIEPVARVLLGEPNGRLSSQSELRFGTNGSLSVDLKKGVFHDFEANEGGGVLDLIERYTHLTGAEAFKWIEEHHIKEAPRVVSFGNIIETYDYTDEAGKLLYQVVRFDPKTFRQQHRNASGDFKWGRGSAPLVPYRLPELIEALANGNVVFIVEGEKDVNNLRRLGIPATTNSGGAGNWDNSINKWFDGADLVVIADNDPQATDAKGKLLFHEDGRPRLPGQDHANHVCAELQDRANRVRYLDLKKAWPACPPKGDISNWLDAGGSPEQLFAIADDLPDWSPDQAAPLAVCATPYKAPDPATIPKRAWLHGGHYIRDVCTATVAPGGFGKTTLSLFEAITMVSEGLHVWYISGEDPKVEIDRRIAAHCQHHNFNLAACPGKFFVDDKTTFSFFIAKSPRAASVMFEEALLAGFEAAITADKIDVVILDPFVSFHAVPENDNGAIDAVCKRLGLIAYRQHCCIEISHHVRKQAPGQTVITVDDTRGGGAIVNAVRSSRVINRMSGTEADRAKIMADQRSSYIRLDRGKRNMAPPDAANWFRIVSVLLPNSDNVQSIEEWAFPKAQGVTDVDTAWVRVQVRNNMYRTSSKSPDWLGIPIAKHFGLDLKKKGSVIFVNKAINDWVRTGVLTVIMAKDDARREREFYAVKDDVNGSAQDNEPSSYDDDETI